MPPPSPVSHGGPLEPGYSQHRESRVRPRRWLRPRKRHASRRRKSHPALLQGQSDVAELRLPRIRHSTRRGPQRDRLRGVVPTKACRGGDDYPSPKSLKSVPPSPRAVPGAAEEQSVSQRSRGRLTPAPLPRGLPARVQAALIPEAAQRLPAPSRWPQRTGPARGRSSACRARHSRSAAPAASTNPTTNSRPLDLLLCFCRRLCSAPARRSSSPWRATVSAIAGSDFRSSRDFFGRFEIGAAHPVLARLGRLQRLFCGAAYCSASSSTLRAAASASMPIFLDAQLPLRSQGGPASRLQRDPRPAQRAVPALRAALTRAPPPLHAGLASP